VSAVSVTVIRSARVHAPVTRRIVDTPDGRRLVVSRDIDANPDRVWDLFVDTRQWPA
jgi:hypothetical protein